MNIGAVTYQNVQNFTQSQAAPPPAAASFEVQNNAVGKTQTQTAVQPPENANRNQDLREARRDRIERANDNGPAREARGPRGQNVDIRV